MRVLHFTSDTGKPAQIPISDRIAEGMRERIGFSITEIPGSEGALQLANGESSLVAVLLTGVVEAVAEQAKMAAVAESTVLVNEAEQILERTTDEQIGRGVAALREVETAVTQPGGALAGENLDRVKALTEERAKPLPSRYRSGGYEGAQNGATFGSYGIHVRGFPTVPHDNVWWTDRIRVFGDEGGDAETYRDLILLLLQAAESEARQGRDLLRAPKACEDLERHANESDALVSALQTENGDLLQLLEGQIGESPDPAGVFQFAEGREGEIYQRGEDGLMRRVATVVEENASPSLQRRIVRLLQADACEGGNLAGAPAACRMAWESLKERDERINVLNSRILEMSKMVEEVDVAAGERPEGFDLATHVGNLRAKVDFAAKDGYVRAFYLMAEYLGVGGAKTLSPSVVFDEQVMPALKELIRFRQANIGQNEVGDIVRAAARALDIEMAADERALSFFREEVIPAIKVLKSHSDVNAAFDAQELKEFRDVAALDAMKIIMQVRLVNGFSAMTDEIASLAFAMADGMVEKRG